jgi:gallate decarboxylase subunit D
LYQEEVKVSYGDGRYIIFISAFVTKDGISAIITGGEKPHVGGSALSVPRPGNVEGKINCDTWITPRPGHRDSEVAALVSRLICTHTGMTAAVIAGIHIDRAEPEEINRLIENSREAAQLLINIIKEFSN